MEMSHSRAHIHVTGSFGQRAADVIANGMGSWTFIIAQSLLIVLWVILNVVAFLGRWDPYPFILLNLLFSTQAAYAAPIIMMSQNRQAFKDHLRDDHEAQEVELLFKINQHQLEILHLLRQRISPDMPSDQTRNSLRSNARPRTLKNRGIKSRLNLALISSDADRLGVRGSSTHGLASTCPDGATAVPAAV